MKPIGCTKNCVNDYSTMPRGTACYVIKVEDARKMERHVKYTCLLGACSSSGVCVPNNRSERCSRVGDFRQEQ
ncbi:hypothetical protein V5799_021665 [Amblyomma americanum]|uniref:Evasin n=1 Tax=Amblyomma americanum TaxID=6943 RepID=A0AAQ4FMS7_AMBAM